MADIIGKTEKGKLYHIVNRMDGGDHFGLCGCYMPKELHEDGLNAFKLYTEGKMCENCMKSRYFKGGR